MTTTTNAAPVSPINTSKVRSAIDAAKKEVSALYKDVVARGESDPAILAGLQSIGKVNLALDKAVEKLNAAVEKTTPKAKEPKAEKAEKAAEGGKKGDAKK